MKVFWVKAGYADRVYAAAYKALKPGGILGVEEHRAKPGIFLQASIKTGYMSEDEVIAAVEKAGFKLVSKSEINANPKDTKDYPGGVWTLPPILIQGQKEQFLGGGQLNAREKVCHLCDCGLAKFYLDGRASARADWSCGC